MPRVPLALVAAAASLVPAFALARHSPEEEVDLLALARERYPARGVALEEQQGQDEISGLGEDEVADYEVVVKRTLPHEGAPWTQGLEIDADGRIIETSGNYPEGVGSFVRILDPQSGKPLRTITEGLKNHNGDHMFIEGIVEKGGHWFATTYEDKVAIEYDKDFKVVGNYPYRWQGWGLTLSPDGKSFLATNGSEYVMSLTTDTWQLKDAKVAHCLGKRVEGLNELEMVDNFAGTGPALLGNVINSRLVLALNPTTMQCKAVFHLDDLSESTERNEAFGYHVANGIAYNKKTNTFFVTGKNWKSMFEIEVSKASPSLLDNGGGKATRMLKMKLLRAGRVFAEEMATEITTA